MDIKLYRCSVCGQITAVINNTGSPLVCCGKPMEELTAGSVDASHEKHVPILTTHDSIAHVKIGSTLHPMTEAHSICWAALRTRHGWQIKRLAPGDEPRVCFRLCQGDEAETAYAYCNLHGLWRS